jgi:hypothetical protein
MTQAPPPPPPSPVYVYWEAKQAGDAFAWFRNDVDVAIRGSFEAAGYARVDRAGLVELMTAQVERGGRSVVVFAANRIPPELMEPADAGALLRAAISRRAGGSSFSAPTRSASSTSPGSGALVDFDFANAERVLGLR